MEDLVRMRRTLQVSMNFLGALTAGVEEAVGEPAKSISYLAGERLGMRMAGKAEKTNDLEKALLEVRRVLGENDCLWNFELFKAKARRDLIQAGDKGDEAMLVFRDCMIRQSLFCYGHHQKGSLCNLMFGFFAGALKSITGRNSTLEIVHAGENACLKKLTIERPEGSMSRAMPGRPKKTSRRAPGRRKE